MIEGASATIPPGHKVGLVGRNGTGKTTLFRLIRGELALESGQIHVPKRTKIGGVAQEVPSSSTSLLDTVLAADTERAALLKENTDDPARIAEIQTRLADIDAWSAEARAASILKGLPSFQTRSPISKTWRTFLWISAAITLGKKGDVLLLSHCMKSKS